MSYIKLIITGYLRIQGRMQILEKLIPEGFKSRFDTLER